MKFAAVKKLSRILAASILCGLILTLPACSTQQASRSGHEVANDTGSALGSLVDGVKAVVVWPFHVIGDLFS